MQSNPKSRVISDGGVVLGQDGPHFTGFADGIDSFSHPLMIKPTQLRWLENGVTRGAIPQCRPGYLTRFLFDLTNNSVFNLWWLSVGQPIIHPQMAGFFQPSFGNPQWIMCVSGSVWMLPFNPDGSFGTAQLIASAPFSQYASQINGQVCVQTATIINGVYANNQVPRNLIVMQDGINRACIWDGTSFQRMNPEKNITVTPAGDTLFTDGYNETPVGLWMMWSGNRLWVFNGPVGRASDLQDPTHFTEEMIFNSGTQWVFPQDVTGAIDRGISGTTTSQGIVFTRDTTFAMATGVQQRLPDTNGNGGWINTPNFQTKLFSGVGCVAGKSPVVHRGLLYWMSADGIVVFDSTGTVFSTQNLPPIDQELAYSKRRMSDNTSIACAGYRDSYVFWSVPVGQTTNGRAYNGHTQVLDRQTTIVHSLSINGPYTYGTIGWQGIWTGIRPVQWVSCDVGGQNRAYALSMDADGQVRIWEAFQGNRMDNGQQIPWSMETRLHPVAPSAFETSIFRHARLLVDQLMGNLSVSIAWRGMRGAYKALFSGSFTASPGSVLLPTPSNVPITSATSFANYCVQTRDIVTPDVRGAISDTVCQAAGVESPWPDSRDHAFGLLMQFQGRAAVLGYRIAADTTTDEVEGNAAFKDETGFNIVPGSGCPEHVDGTTPDYIFGPSSARDAFAPVIPLYDGSDPIYQSPTS